MVVIIYFQGTCICIHLVNFQFGFQSSIGYRFWSFQKTPFPWIYTHIISSMPFSHINIIDKVILWIFYDKEINIELVRFFLIIYVMGQYINLKSIPPSSKQKSETRSKSFRFCIEWKISNIRVAEIYLCYSFQMPLTQDEVQINLFWSDPML